MVVVQRVNFFIYYFEDIFANYNIAWTLRGPCDICNGPQKKCKNLAMHTDIFFVLEWFLLLKIKFVL